MSGTFKGSLHNNLEDRGINEKIISFFSILLVSVSKYFIIFLDFLSEVLKYYVNEKPVRKESGTQTGDSQDLLDLITHHFGALHEENHINKIVYKSLWNKMNSELILIKEQVHCQYNCLNLFKEELKELNDAIKSVKDLVSSNSHNKLGSLNVDIDQKSYIPPPPPLPPPGFISPDTNRCVFRTNNCARKKRIFEGNCAIRPLITVESLKEVKLKKIPSPRKFKDEEKDEEKDGFPIHTKNLRKVLPNEFSKKRPKTADHTKIKQKTNMTISPSRPMTSDS